MIRTQIQLPDELYRRAKALAEAREVSLAELVRNGLEHELSSMTPPGAACVPEGLPVVEAPPELAETDYPEWGVDTAWANVAESGIGKGVRE